MKIAVNPATIESAPLFWAGARGVPGIELIAGKIPLLLDGTAAAATNAETQALLYSQANPRLRIILTVSECSYRIVARRSRGIAAPADLKGKTVGTTRHTTAHYYAVITARKAGLGDGDLRIVDVPQAEMPAALERGAIDALAIWEPIVDDAARRLGGDAVLFQDGALFRERFNLNTTADVLADPRQRGTLVGFVRAVVAAAREVREKPAQAWPLLASKINVPEPVIARLWSQFHFPATLPDDLPQLLVDEEDWLAGSQGRPARPRAVVEELIDPSVLAEALL
jgi:sulfonate transport system substrate-binding protein